MDFLSAHDFLMNPRCKCTIHHPSVTVILADPYVHSLSLFSILRQVTQYEAIL